MLAAAVLAGVAGIGATLIATNPAPEVPLISSRDVVESTQPYIVKLHAQWCPVCIITKDEWSDVQEAYAGRVRFVVFNFTTDATTEVSRMEARRLGLDAAFEEYSGETGTVLVLDGRSKEVRHVLHGMRNVAEYRAAIDAALSGKHD